VERRGNTPFVPQGVPPQSLPQRCQEPFGASGQPPILFPFAESDLSDAYAKRLFRMSSPLPPTMLHQARILEATIADGARGFAFNADLVSVIMFLDIGTRIDRNLG